MTHYYKNGVLVPKSTPMAIPSVTTILAVRDKPSLREWRESVGSKAADAHQIARAALGTEVHRCIELLVKNEIATSLVKEIGPYLSGFINWQKKFKPSKMDPEIFLESKLYGYCGTADLLCFIDGVLYIVDWKTGKKSIDTALQLAAYQQAIFEMFGVKAKRAAVYLTDKTKRGYQWVPFDEQDDERDLQAFLAHKQIFDWLKGGLAAKKKVANVVDWDYKSLDSVSVM
jgi:hypothetical protein